MAITAAEIFTRAASVLQDDTHARWPLKEMVRWLNDAMREVVLQKPNANARTVIMALQAGTYQTISNTDLALLRVIRNTKSSNSTVRAGGRAIRVINREILDSQHPDWHDTDITPPADVVKHAAFDIADPRVFYVYPPNTGDGFVEISVSSAPAVIALGSPDPEDIDEYNSEISLPDIYANAILDYVLYRAYLKDAQFAGNSQRAAAHYQQFANSLQMKVNVEALANPNITARAEPPVGVAP